MLREAESAFLVPWKRKIILREAESAFLVPWKRKIMLQEAESVFLVPWKRENNRDLQRGPVINFFDF
jgi:hypothetical protein